MERVKDFLYDISDLFFSLLIIGIIFFVVSFKLTDTMSVSWFSNIDTPEIADIELPDATTPIDNEVVEVVPEEEEVVPEEEEAVPEEEVAEIRDVAFVIESGSVGYTIAKNLLAEELILDIDEFLQTLSDMGLGNKLQAGTFSLNTGMTTEEIIRILARQ